MLGLLATDGQPEQEKLVLNDVVEVSVQTAQEVLDGKWGHDWALGYAITVHWSQGITIEDPQRVWILDELNKYSILPGLALVFPGASSMMTAT
ncbi:MAG: hypothetical protein GXN93_04700 [Candidatus Diapherotrites archaeon]|nr:hypothetical protein [Candidatus Diapherotrites archaeon]